MSTERRENARIALILRASRNMLGMTLKQLGDVIDAAPSSIGKWENNELGMRATTYLRLINYLNSKGIEIDINEDDLEDEVVFRVKSSFLDAVSSNQQDKELFFAKRTADSDISRIRAALAVEAKKSREARKVKKAQDRFVFPDGEPTDADENSDPDRNKVEK